MTEPGTAVRMALPNDFGVELLGRCALYSFSYQRMVTPMLGLEAAVSGLGGGGDGEGATVLFGSAGARLYFLKKNASPFVTGGIVGISASTDSGPFGDGNATSSYWYLGPGLEFRAPGGFLFRGTVYGLIADGSYFIWPGLAAGYAF